MRRFALGTMLFLVLAAIGLAGETLTYPRCRLRDLLASGAPPAGGMSRFVVPVEHCEAQLTYDGKIRPTPEAHARFLREMERANGLDPNAFAGYVQEASFREGDATYWLLVFGGQVATLQAAKPGRTRLRVRLAWLGSTAAEPVLVVHELRAVGFWSALLGGA